MNYDKELKILIQMTLNLLINLWRTNTLKVLSLQMNECGTHLFSQQKFYNLHQTGLK